MDAVLRGVHTIEDEENLLVRDDQRGEHHYLQIWSFTSHCNWLDVVELTFTAQESSE